MEKSELVISDNPIRIGISKRGGRMYTASCDALKKWWDFAPPEDAGTKGQELKDISITPDNKPPIRAQLLVSRIKDIIEDVNDGLLDIGIVSCDAVAEWKAAKREALKRAMPGVPEHEIPNPKPCDFTQDIGNAGSRLMIGVARTFLYATTGKTATWRDAVKFSYANDIPVFTTFKEDLSGFLIDQDLPVPRMIVRDGTIEARARMHGGILIADLVESGETMLANGFDHTIEIRPSRMQLIANTKLDAAKRPEVMRLINRLLYGQPSIMDVNRLFLTLEPGHAA